MYILITILCAITGLAHGGVAVVARPSLPAPAVVESETVRIDFAGELDEHGVPAPWIRKKKTGEYGYRVERAENRSIGTAVHFVADRSSFSLNRKVRIDPEVHDSVTWFWRAEELPPGGDLRTKRNDQAVQVLLFFQGGKTLSYVWDTTAPVGTSSDESVPLLARVKVLVLRSGTEGLGEWQVETRNFAADFRRLHGRPPGQLRAIRVQSNSQHTKSVAKGAFGPLLFHPKGGRTGSLTVLTYNIAGLPELISQSHPERNVPIIGPKLDLYDLVLVQEDFAYHDELYEAVSLPVRSAYSERGERLYGSGLTLLSRLRFEPLAQVRWEACHGDLLRGAGDCLADKGFSYTQLELSEETSVDVYNLHADAGSSSLDRTARSSNFEQLAAFIVQKSAGRALIVAGDTNLDYRAADDALVLSRFLERTGLQDAGQVVGSEATGVDRIFFRSASGLQLIPVRAGEDERFTDGSGEPLSDHPAVFAEFRWTSP